MTKFFSGLALIGMIALGVVLAAGSATTSTTLAASNAAGSAANATLGATIAVAQCVIVLLVFVIVVLVTLFLVFAWKAYRFQTEWNVSTHAPRVIEIQKTFEPQLPATLPASKELPLAKPAVVRKVRHSHSKRVAVGVARRWFQ